VPPGPFVEFDVLLVVAPVVVGVPVVVSPVVFVPSVALVLPALVLLEPLPADVVVLFPLPLLLLPFPLLPPLPVPPGNSQAPSTHCCRPEQDWQAAPPTPQLPKLEFWQTPAVSQQPVQLSGPQELEPQL